MTQLITELLDHARLASNGLSLSVIEIDLVSALVEAIAAHEYGTTPRITFRRPAGSVRVHGDPARIAQILDNLLGNALKYSAADAPIEVSLHVQGAEAQVRITDHGVGIPADERHLLFTPFYRTSTTRNTRGTGLGLHISKRLAESHGGRLWLEASSSDGSVFALALPLPVPLYEQGAGTSHDLDRSRVAAITSNGQ
jgi:signal transduction histidine kinase